MHKCEPAGINRVDGDAFLIEFIVQFAPGSGIPHWDSVGMRKRVETPGEPKDILSTGQLAQRDGYLMQRVEIS